MGLSRTCGTVKGKARFNWEADVVCARPFGWLLVPACKGAIRQMNCGLVRSGRRSTRAPNLDSSSVPPACPHHHPPTGAAPAMDRVRPGRREEEEERRSRSITRTMRQPATTRCAPERASARRERATIDWMTGWCNPEMNSPARLTDCCGSPNGRLSLVCWLPSGP